MMITILVSAQTVSAGTIAVEWRLGDRGGQVLVPVDMALPASLSQSDYSRAELVAMGFLLLKRKVVGQKYLKQKLTLLFSEKMALDAFQDISSDLGLRNAARGLQVVFGDAICSLHYGPLPTLKAPLVSRLMSSKPQLPALAMICGKVVVTVHALEQFAFRYRIATLAHAYHLLQRWASRATQPVTLPPAVLAHKEQVQQEPALYYTDGSGWHGTIVDNTLVTMFFRKN